MLRDGTTQTREGETVPLRANIPQTYAEALYRTVLGIEPETVIEIGMAFGVSTLAILAAVEATGSTARVISIDPVQTTAWKNAGIAAVQRAGFGDRHTLIEDFDYKALPELLSSSTRCQFSYIDGWHTFDNAFLDWWYVDKMLDDEGVVGFNDCGWEAVDKVIRFMLGHRHYSEFDVGLRRTYADIGRRQEVIRMLARTPKGRWYRQVQDRYFRKADDWVPTWNHFEPF